MGTVSAQITPVRFPWDWHIKVQPIDSNIPEVPIWLWGNAQVNMSEPVLVGGTGPTTFDLGPGGDFATDGPFPSAQVPPLGGVYEIPIEIVQMELTTSSMARYAGAV